MEGYTDHAHRSDGNKSAEKSAEKPSSDMSESLNAETVIAAKEPSLKEEIPLVDEKSGDLAMSIDELSKQSRDQGDQSAENRDFESRPDVNTYRSPRCQPDEYRKIEHYDYPRVPDATSGSSERTDAWNRLFGNRLMDPDPYDKMDPYEERLRVRESETLQAMIKTQKELIKKTRDRESEEILEAEKRNYVVCTQSDLRPERDSRPERIFQTPERHTPDPDLSGARDRSRDAERVKERLFDGNRNSSNSEQVHVDRRVTGQELRSEAFPPRLDNEYVAPGIGNFPDNIGNVPSPGREEFYPERRSPFEQRRSPYGAVSENPMPTGPTHFVPGEFLPLEPEQVLTQLFIHTPLIPSCIYGLFGIA